MKKLWSVFLLWRALYKDKRTPFATKMLPILALIYVLIPVDFVPDVAPLVGWLDDLGMVPLLLWLAWRFVDEKLRKELLVQEEEE